MEIEKKYLVKKIPENLKQYKSYEIEQGYLSTNPTIRIRRWGDRYNLTYKSRDGITPEDGVIVAQEVELPLTKYSYEHLRTKVDGKLIKKTRYLIPMEQDIQEENLTIELDIFHGDLEGRMLAEIEFQTVQKANEFAKPEWLGENVSNQPEYSNSYMSGENVSLH